MSPATFAPAAPTAAIDRAFDYTQQVLVAIEYGVMPTQLDGLPDGYAVFRRIPVSEVRQALAGRSDAPPAGGAFERVLAEHMGYWEQHIPAGQQCFVHYAIGQPEVIDGLFDRLSAVAGFPLLGTYSLEAQSCCYPFGFPTNPVPDNVSLGDRKTFTDQSIFWFNFFPAQPYLFEKTFVVWTRFCSSSLPERGECNQLVSASTANRVRASGVDEFVQVNLNRFTNLNGFLASARGAGESTFTVDQDYRWYGMLLRKL